MKVFWIIMLVLLIIILLLFVICAFVYNQIAWRTTIKVPQFLMNSVAGNEMFDDYEQKTKVQEKEFLKYPLESVTLKTPDGAILRGRLLEPKVPNGKIIVACHGARSCGIGEFCFSGPYYYEKGYTLFMPDHRGCGESDGKFMGYGTHESKDTFLWVDYLKKRFPNQSIFLLGVSMGAATVLMMSENLDDDAVKGIISDCSYTSAWDEFSYQLKSSFHLPTFPILNICEMYSRIFAKYSFKDASPITSVKKAKKPILFIHGDKDDFVPYYMMNELYDACASEKDCVTVHGAVHARSYYTNPTVYQNAVESFVNKCMKS